MPEWMTSLMGGAGGGLSYVFVLVLLLLCGLGVPIPEDIILVAGGFAVSPSPEEIPHLTLLKVVHQAGPMVLVGLLGILGGDSIMFGLGRRLGTAMIQKTFLRRYLTPDRLARVDGLFKKHGQKILIAARFMPGVRSVTFFSSGAIGVPYWKFLLFDGLAALVSAPVWIILGYRFGPGIVDTGKKWQGYILGGVAVVVVTYLLVSRWRARRNAPKPAALADARLQPAPVPVPAEAANDRR